MPLKTKDQLLKTNTNMTEPIQIELPTIFEAMTVNAWLIKGKENVLIDCGEQTDAAWEALMAGLKKNGLTLQDISKVVITHAHLDHMGMANRITQHCDAEIWVSEYVHEWGYNLKALLDRRTKVIREALLPNLALDQRDKLVDFGYQRLSPYWEEIPKNRMKVFPMSGPIDFGGQPWEIIYTPGHCINQTCFYQKETGRLLSADMLLPMIPIPIVDATIEPPYVGVKTLVLQLASYKKLQELDITKAYPGHFGILEDIPNLIENQISRIHHRKEKCFQLIESGVSTFMGLLEGVYKERINNATMFMVVGFIELLKREGRIKSELVDGQLFYSLSQPVIIADVLK